MKLLRWVCFCLVHKNTKIFPENLSKTFALLVFLFVYFLCTTTFCSFFFFVFFFLCKSTGHLLLEFTGLDF